MEGVIFDVTARRQGQEEAQRHLNEVAHLARVTAMGEMAAAIAHDLNQPLGAILNNVGVAEMLLATDPPDLVELRAILEDIRADDRRAGEVVRSMRALLRRREVERQALDLNELVRATFRLIATEASLRRVALQMDLAPELPRVSGDHVHLQQVLLNLMVNGLDAMSGGSGSERRLVVGTRRASELEVEAAVSDFGPGFPEDALARVFEPFYTTKKEGLGMGLSIARTIIEMHGGRIEARNRPEGGAAVRFVLPRLDDQEPTESPSG
jgi:C4-dicarboxylate-specific signal transduction histidine kinase